MINEGTGLFEVSYLKKMVLSGQVIVEDNYNVPLIEDREKNTVFTINSNEFYTELKTRGYCYHDAYKCVKNIDLYTNGMFSICCDYFVNLDIFNLIYSEN